MLVTSLAFTLLLSRSRLGRSIPVLRNAKVVVNCAGASGAISCDWLCYDACVSSQSSVYLSADQMEQCLSVINKACTVPATAHNVVVVSEFCSVSAESPKEVAAEEVPVDQYTVRNPGYLATLPKISNQHWKWEVQNSVIQAMSVDVDGDFDSEYCLVPSSYKVTATGAEIIRNDKNICAEEEYNVEVRETETELEMFDTTTSFGFKKLNLNFTQWARNYESKYEALGLAPTNVRLTSLNTCWAPASNMTLHYSVNFTVRTDELNAARAGTGDAVSLALVLGWLLLQ
eukprot:Gregarina_sp_Pseudo_9__5713@NODE_824_length_2160_cov_94_663366_g773_i0_p2_GENE_NODE_824_length_2160_cov_94_663366_g773_i0NODE_824_length_2160_cov_94_663366_g773_i0_p2_ORF_typecomplete_len287_score89_59DUF2280/PF10045_9/0_14FGARAT_linker/PF18072_1/14FGARAT_linker/PF18072_1/1e02_NODE_824_length_2160_cov_94_663366_g773_i011722032